MPSGISHHAEWRKPAWELWTAQWQTRSHFYFTSQPPSTGSPVLLRDNNSDNKGPSLSSGPTWDMPLLRRDRAPFMSCKALPNSMRFPYNTELWEPLRLFSLQRMKCQTQSGCPFREMWFQGLRLSLQLAICDGGSGFGVWHRVLPISSSALVGQFLLYSFPLRKAARASKYPSWGIYGLPQSTSSALVNQQKPSITSANTCYTM